MSKKNFFNKKLNSIFSGKNSTTNTTTNNNNLNSFNRKQGLNPDFDISQKFAVEFENFSAEISCNLKDVKYQIISVELDRQDIGLAYNESSNKIEGVPLEPCSFNVTIKYKIFKWKFLQEQKSCSIRCEVRKNTNLPRLKFRVNNVKQFEEVNGLKIVHYDKAVDRYCIEAVNFLDENVNDFVYNRSENEISGFPTKIAQCSLEVKYYYKNLFPGKMLTNNVDFFVLENKQALKLNLFVNSNNKPIKQFENFTAKFQSNNTNLHAQNWEIISINNFMELHKKGIDINVKNKTISGNTLFSGDFFVDIEYDVIVDGKAYSFAERVPLKIISNEEKLHANISSLGTAKHCDFYYNKINIIPKITNNIYFEPRVVNVIIDNNKFYYNNDTQEITGFVNNKTDINVTIEYDYPELSKLPNLSKEFLNTKVFTSKQIIKVNENSAKPRLDFVLKNAYYNVPFSESLELSNKFVFAVIDNYYIIDIKFNRNCGLSYNRLTKKIEGTPIPNIKEVIKAETKKDDKTNNNKADNKSDNKNDKATNNKKPTTPAKIENETIIATVIYTYHKDKLSDYKWSELVKLQSEVKFNICKDPPQKVNEENSKYRKENSANEFIKGKEKSIIAARQCVNTDHQKDNHCENDFYIKYHSEHDCYISILADGSNSAKFSYYASKLVVNVAGEIIYNNLAKNLPNIETIFNLYYNNPNNSNSLDKFDKDKTDFEKNIKRSLYSLIGISVFTAYKKLEQEYNTNKNLIGDIKNLSTTLLIGIIKKIGEKWLCVSYSIGDGVIVIYDNKKKASHHHLLLGKISNVANENNFLSKKEISSYESIIKCINVSVVDNFTAFIMMNNGIAMPKFQTENNLKKVETWNNFWAELNKEIPNLLSGEKVKNSSELTAKDLMKWLNFADEKNQNDRVLAMIY